MINNSMINSSIIGNGNSFGKIIQPQKKQKKHKNEDITLVLLKLGTKARVCVNNDATKQKFATKIEFEGQTLYLDEVKYYPKVGEKIVLVEVFNDGHGGFENLDKIRSNYLNITVVGSVGKINSNHDGLIHVRGNTRWIDLFSGTCDVGSCADIKIDTAPCNVLQHALKNVKPRTDDSTSDVDFIFNGYSVKNIHADSGRVNVVGDVDVISMVRAHVEVDKHVEHITSNDTSVIIRHF
jgi:hypothetical protein